MKTLFSVLLALGVAGCSSKIALKTHYDQHNLAFKKANAYLEHRVPRGQYTLYAREFYKDDKGKKSTVVLMHGFPDSLHLYDELIPYLKNNHVIAFDYLGWGNSDKPKDHRYDSQSLYRDLEAIVKYFNLDRIVLVTHDASGPPGIDWAIANPEKIEKLVLLNTYYQPMEVLVPPEAIKRFSTPGVYRNISVWMGSHLEFAWLNGYTTQISKFMMDQEKKDHYVKLLAHQSLESRSAFFDLNRVLIDEMKERDNKIQSLKSFQKPVAIIFGNDDPYLNKNVAKEFKNIFTNATLTLVKHAGHYVQIDQPKEVANAMLNQEFIEK